MPGGSSRIHENWFAAEMAAVTLPDDLERVLEAYADATVPLNVEDSPLLRQLAHNVATLAEVLDEPDLLTDEEQRVAVAGLRYYLKLNDRVPDYFGAEGHTDDALVVQCAMRRLGPTLQRLGYFD